MVDRVCVLHSGVASMGSNGRGEMVQSWGQGGEMRQFWPMHMLAHYLLCFYGLELLGGMWMWDFV